MNIVISCVFAWGCKLAQLVPGVANWQHPRKYTGNIREVTGVTRTVTSRFISCVFPVADRMHGHFMIDRATYLAC